MANAHVVRKYFSVLVWLLLLCFILTVGCSYYNSIQIRTRKMPNSIINVFFKKFNQKANLGRCPMPEACSDIPILKVEFWKNLSKINFGCINFGFRGDKYIAKKVKVVPLACDMSTGPYLCLYQLLSKYFKSRPRWLIWMHRPTGDQEVAGSTLTEVGNILSWRLIVKYFLWSFYPFR